MKTTSEERAKIAVGCDDTCAADHPHRFLRLCVEAAIELAERDAFQRGVKAGIKAAVVVVRNMTCLPSPTSQVAAIDPASIEDL